MQKKYDLIVPLGNNCSMARTLEMLGLRRYSCPFDWLLANDEDALAQACGLLETHFADFLRPENLKKQADSCDNGKHVSYYDEGSRRLFLHDFTPRGDIKAVNAKYKRRIERLYALINKSNSILFVYTAPSPGQATDEQCRSAYARLTRLVGPGKEVDFFAMKYSSDRAGDHYADSGEHVLVSEDARPFDMMFMHYLSPLARFLMGVQAGRECKPHSLLERIYYKINKHTGKWLKKRHINLPKASPYE